MDREFSWNLPDINAIRERREREQLGLAESEALKARRALRFQNDLAGARQAQQDQMAEQAQMARWMELENKFANRTMDPRMKMAAIAGADNNTYDKLTGAIIPLYRSKFEDLLKKGAKSRMGASWDAGWGLHLSRSKEERKRRKIRNKNREEAMDGLLPR